MARVVTWDGASRLGSSRLREQPGVAIARTIQAAAVVCRRVMRGPRGSKKTFAGVIDGRALLASMCRSGAVLCRLGNRGQRNRLLVMEPSAVSVYIESVTGS